MDVLWLTPDKPTNISVGRRRIADKLEEVGHRIDLRGTTRETIVQSISERGRYDCIVGTTRSGAIAGLVLSRVLGVPLVVDHIDPIRQIEETHPPWISAPTRVVESATFRLASHVLFVYEEERERVTRQARASTKTDLGVDFDRFSDPDPSVLDAARDRYESYDLAENVAVYVGGLEPLYNVRNLLDAAEYLEDWSLLVLGAGSLSDEVERAAEQGNVVFPGTVPHEEVPGLLHLADVGVCLVNDAHTLKTLEYGAAGLPVVHLRGYAEDRFGDLLTYTGLEPRSIADAIRSVDTDDGSLRSFVAQFDWGSIAETYESVLADATKRPSQP